MAKTHRNYRLDADLVAQVEAWAQAHGTNNSDAVAQLLSRGLVDQDEQPDLDERDQDQDEQTPGADLVAVLRGNVADLRGQVTTLTAQLAAKDEQISGLMALAGRAQALQAAEAARSLDAGKDTDLEAEAVTTDEAEPQEAAGAHESDGIDQEGQEPADVAQEPAHEPTRRGLRSWLRDLFGI